MSQRRGEVYTVDTMPTVYGLHSGDVIEDIASGKELDGLERTIAANICRTWVPKRPLSAEMRPRSNRTIELCNITAIVNKRSHVADIGLLVIAGLRSAGFRELMQITRIVSYTCGQEGTASAVVRRLGPMSDKLEAEEMGAQLLAEAAANSNLAMEYALRHVYAGGAPGLGKR